MAIRGKPTVKNPYGDDKGLGVPTIRKRTSAGTGARPANKGPKTKHYVTLVMDESGILQWDHSLAMSAYASQIFTADATERFREACHRIDTGVNPDIPLVKPDLQDFGPGGAKKSSKKRRRSEQESSDVCVESRDAKVSSHYRRTGKMMAIRVSDQETIDKYYETCLRAFQQINCRLICKLWIKLIHPKKQVTNPYNGTMKGTKGKDPEMTKPGWWAPDVRHKEPDHLKRWERVKLMVRIVNYCVRDDSAIPEKITIDQLLEEVEKKSMELHGGPNNDKEGRLQFIRDICHLRTMQKRYENGEIDAEAICEVESHEEHARKAEREEASNESRLEAALPEDEGNSAKFQTNFEPLEITHDPPMLTPASSTTTSPSVYQPYGLNEPQLPHTASQFQSTLAPYSPESMTSYQPTSATSPFTDLHSMHHHTLALASQHSFGPPAMDPSQEHMAALNGAFVPAARTESSQSWPSQVHPSTNNYPGHMPSFSNESDTNTSMHGLPLGQVSFMYGNQTQDDSAGMPCFQGVNQLDPRQLGFYRGMS